MDHAVVVAATRRWIADVVIGWNLCPFARRVFEAERIRYVVSDVGERAALLRVLATELESLAAATITSVETTLLIHPHVLQDYLDYNEFLDAADRLLTQLGLRGKMQIAGFHPAYQFADAQLEAVENYTNRSPFPMLHLLREDSISAIAGDPDELLEIPRRNIAALRALGIERVVQQFKACSEGPCLESDRPPC